MIFEYVNLLETCCGYFNFIA